MLYTKKNTKKKNKLPVSVAINSKLNTSYTFQFHYNTVLHLWIKNSKFWYTLTNRNGKRIWSVLIFNLLVRYFHSVLPDLQECFQQFQVVAIHRPSVIIHISHHKLHQATRHGSVLNIVLSGKTIKCVTKTCVSPTEQQIPVQNNKMCNGLIHLDFCC